MLTNLKCLLFCHFWGLQNIMKATIIFKYIPCLKRQSLTVCSWLESNLGLFYATASREICCAVTKENIIILSAQMGSAAFGL